MNKILTKTVKKVTIWSAILAVILVAGIVLGAIFGFNKSLTVKDYSTVIVKMDKAEPVKEATLKEICDAAINTVDGYDCRIESEGQKIVLVYVFDGDWTLQAEKQAVQAAIDAEMSGRLNGATGISVLTGNEKVQAYMAKGTIVRGVIAAAVFAVLAFAYVSLRYKLRMGILTAVCSLIGGLVTGAILIVTRIPVTVSAVYVIAFGVILSALTTIFTCNNLRVKEKEASESVEETVVASVAVKEIATLCIASATAMVLMGAIATASTRWFAVAALVAVIVAAFIGLIFAPALYVPMKKCADENAKARSRYDYKKGAKKTKKVKTAKKVEEKIEAAPVEETPVEEVVKTVEETEEAAKEETVETAEEAEAPAEETAPVEAAPEEESNE